MVVVVVGGGGGGLAEIFGLGLGFEAVAVGGAAPFFFGGKGGLSEFFFTFLPPFSPPSLFSIASFSLALDFGLGLGFSRGGSSSSSSTLLALGEGKVPAALRVSRLLLTGDLIGEL